MTDGTMRSGEAGTGRPAPMTRPRALRPGDTIGLCAPSGPVAEPARVGLAIGKLEELGFRVKAAPGCAEAYGYLAGSDEIRAGGLNSLFGDPEVDGIICLKGGYGTPRILDRIDWGLIARNPKVFIGYSDITAIHLGINRLCSLVTFHGPMPSSDMLPDFDDFSRASLLSAIGSTCALGKIANPPGRLLECVVPGTAEGRLIGGNLSLVAATVGTPWQIDAKDAILFLEDVDEAPYRIDRMLTQLRLAGILDACRALVFGDWNNCMAVPGKKSLSLSEIFTDIVPEGKPVLANLGAGHCSPKLTLPMGVAVRLDAGALLLEYLEPAAL